jgi:hypothetical protein
LPSFRPIRRAISSSYYEVFRRGRRPEFRNENNIDV